MAKIGRGREGGEVGGKAKGWERREGGEREGRGELGKSLRAGERPGKYRGEAWERRQAGKAKERLGAGSNGQAEGERKGRGIEGGDRKVAAAATHKIC